MCENPKRKEILGSVNWPETMWPLKTDVLTGIPTALLPDVDLLNKLTYPWELLALLRETLRQRVVENKIGENVAISNLAVIEGPVWIEDGVKILSFSTVLGPTYLGNGTFVGNYAMIRQCIIGGKCLVGGYTEMVRSVISPECTFHKDYIGDSLIGKETDFGGDSATANLRLDRKTVRSLASGERIDTGLETFGAIIGAHAKIAGGCMVQPGVKIGENCILGPGVILTEDLPDNHRCIASQQNQITSLTINSR